MNAAATRFRRSVIAQKPSAEAQSSPLRLSVMDAVAILASLFALAYLFDVAGAQTRLILFLQSWSTVLRGSHDSVISVGIAIFPFAVGGLLLTLCAGMLQPGSVSLRRRR